MKGQNLTLALNDANLPGEISGIIFKKSFE